MRLVNRIEVSSTPSQDNINAWWVLNVTRKSLPEKYFANKML